VANTECIVEKSRAADPHPTRKQPTIALLTFSYEIEDFLDKIKVSLESFCTEMTGGWLFGFMEALRRHGVRTVLVCVSGRVTEPTSFTHAATGYRVWALPSPAAYRCLKRRIPNPYGRSVEQAFGSLRGSRRLRFPLLWLIKEVAPYMATPTEALAEVLRSEGCDAILCQEYEYARFDVCVRLGRKLRLPVFAVFQGGDYQRGRVERMIRPRTIRAASGLIIATRKEAERVRHRYRITDSKLARIFNPLDVNKWRPMDRNAARAALDIPRTAKVVAWHGRVSLQQKGLDVLLSAWESVCRQQGDQDLRLLVVGTGQDAGQFRQRIESMHLRGVHWLNEYVLDGETIRRHLSAADVYAFPSRHEGFPVAPIEAMACTLPVVTANANGIADIFEDGETSGGIIVPREDADALARALIRLLDNETLRHTLGERARKRVEACFSLEAVGQQLRDFLCARGLPHPVP
jgi:glycosyltransferase involved in cell wall biosynthesis